MLVPSYERDGRLYIIARLFHELLGICREKKTSDFCWPFVIRYKKKRFPAAPTKTNKTIEMMMKDDIKGLRHYLGT